MVAKRLNLLSGNQHMAGQRSNPLNRWSLKFSVNLENVVVQKQFLPVKRLPFPLR
jgi:hypothetical protein